jgi:hypothetical protein
MDMYEPLIIIVTLPIAFVCSYHGPWVAKGIDSVVRAEGQLTRGFKLWRESRHDPRQLHELEGYVLGVWKGPEACSRSVLLKFLMHRGSFPPCGNVWCGDCYVPHPNDPFPVQDLPEEEEGIEAELNEDHANARGRDGDHLMGVPFECDLCHFRNVKKRDPILSDPEDGYTLLCIRS